MMETRWARLAGLSLG